EHAREMRAVRELDEPIVERIVQLDVAADLLLLLAADIADDLLERRCSLLERRDVFACFETLGREARRRAFEHAAKLPRVGNGGAREGADDEAPSRERLEQP